VHSRPPRREHKRRAREEADEARAAAGAADAAPAQAAPAPAPRQPLPAPRWKPSAEFEREFKSPTVGTDEGSGAAEGVAAVSVPDAQRWTPSADFERQFKPPSAGHATLGPHVSSLPSPRPPSRPSSRLSSLQDAAASATPRPNDGPELADGGADERIGRSGTGSGRSEPAERPDLEYAPSHLTIDEIAAAAEATRLAYKLHGRGCAISPRSRDDNRGDY
jgi:hypothetical protein